MTRRAFTLVELLAVMAIAGVLFALVLPAIQTARESGRRAVCESRLRQIGIALENYHDGLGCFPPGRTPVFDPRAAGDSYPCNSLLVDRSPLALLLPFLDEQIASDGLNQSLAAYSPENCTLKGRFFRQFLCPSDSGRETRVVDPARFPLIPASTPGAFNVGRTSYIANFGTLNVWAIPASGVACRAAAEVISQVDGVFNDIHPIRRRDVLDGASKTLFFTERHLAGLDNDLDASSAEANETWWFTGNIGDSLGTGTFAPNFGGSPIGGIAKRRAMTASSLHPGGVLALFGDSSIRFIGSGIDSWGDGGGVGPRGATLTLSGAWNGLPSKGVWQGLWTRSGGESPSDF